jgi:site-specific DNA-methyltransferase (adenine-specific)
LSFSQDITRERFAYVPIQDFSEQWSDEKLYRKYGLSREDVSYIKSTVRSMEGNDE